MNDEHLNENFEWIFRDPSNHAMSKYTEKYCTLNVIYVQRNNSDDDDDFKRLSTM